MKLELKSVKHIQFCNKNFEEYIKPWQFIGAADLLKEFRKHYKLSSFAEDKRDPVVLEVRRQLRKGELSDMLR